MFSRIAAKDADKLYWPTLSSIDHDEAFTPMILIQRVGVNMKSFGEINKTLLALEAFNCGLCFRFAGIDTNKKLRVVTPLLSLKPSIYTMPLTTLFILCSSTLAPIRAS